MALDATEVGTLFDQIGKSLRVGDVTDTATKTDGTIAAEIEDLTQAIGTDALPATVELTNAVSGAPNAIPSLVSAGLGANTTAVQTPTQNLVIQTIKADSQQPDDGAQTAVKELIRQMAVVGTPQTLNANEPNVIGSESAGTHTGANDAAVLTDATLTLVTNELVGRTIFNTTDVSSATITANTATTITGVLSGGTDDDWDTGDAYTVDGAVVYGTDFNATSASSANNGDGILNASTKRGDGLVNEHILGEVIEGEITSILPTGQASLQFKGELSVGQMSPDWPKGFGGTTTLTSYVGGSGSNMVNGSFETIDTLETNLPLGWVSMVGIANLGVAVGDTFTTTTVEQQTLTITGPPTAGYYVLRHTDKDGNTQDTAQLTWNASGSAVQTALRNLDGLSEITVSTSGTTPLFIHTVTFTGVTNPGTLAGVEDNFTGGTITEAVVAGTAASASVIRGARSIQFTGDGAELTSVAYPVVLQPATVYAVSIWVNNGNDVADGAINIDLVDSTTSPTQITDDQAVVNELGATVVTGDLSTWTQWTMFFRTPTIMPNSVFLRIHVTTAITDTKTVNFDELVMVPAVELYPGGPFTALLTGPTSWVVGDTIRFSPANDQQGLINTWMNRVFNLSGNRLLFGSALAGGETIADSKIS